MGWDFSHSNTRVQEADLVLDCFNDVLTVRKHRLVGNHLWMIVEAPEGIRIVLALLRKGGPDSGYGHKTIVEDEGPYYYDCPETFLREAPAPTGDGRGPARAREWREKVRQYHERKRARTQLAAGQTWIIADGYSVAGQHCRLVRKIKRGWVGMIGGMEYRVMPRMLGQRIV